MKILHVTNYYDNFKYKFEDFYAYWTHHLLLHPAMCCLLVLMFHYNIHNTWPHCLTAFQDFSQTPRQNQIRADQDSPPSSSACPSVASYISQWEQRVPVDSRSQTRCPGTPHDRSRTPASCTSSVGRRRGQRWAPDTEAPATTVVYGLNLEAGTRVSVCVRT